VSEGEGVRIERVTVANEAENKRLAPIPRGEVVTVNPFVQVGIVAVVGGLSAAVPFVTGPALVVITIALGIATSVGLFLGMNVGKPK